MPHIRAISSSVNGDETVMQIAGEEVFFPLQMGNNWGKLRIGIRGYVQAMTTMQGDYVVTDWRFGVAACNGTKGYFHPTPTDVVAFYAGYANNLSGVYTSATIPHSVAVFNGYTVAQKQGANLKTSTISNSTGNLPVKNYLYGGIFCSALYFDIDRVTTPGSFVVSVFGRTQPQLVTVPNTTVSGFITDMATAAPSNFTNLGSTAQTVAYVGTLNVFDTVSVFCNSTSNVVFELATLAVARWL